MKRYTLLYIMALCMVAAVTSTLTSCKQTVKMTTVAVQDSIRHYYPLVQGTDLTLVWDIVNTGKSPLVITDVQPSCGCIEIERKDEYVVIPGKDIHLTFTFHSSKYLGYVKHSIRLYGNIKPEGMATLTFDTNVVPPANNAPDYEQIYKDQQSAELAGDGDIDAKTETNSELDPKQILQDELKRGYWTGKNKPH